LKTFLFRTLFFFTLVNLLLLDSVAQQTPPSNPSAPQPAQTTPAQTTPAQTTPAQTTPAQTTSAQPAGQSTDAQDKKTSDANQGTSKDRLFYALPNFLTLENAGQVPPLTAGQKFKVVARGSFDYILIPWYAALAGISQAENSEPGYGQGAEGYGKRFGAAFADGTIENFITGAILPSVLHQDPRFFQESDGTFLHRTGYAISRILSPAPIRGISNSISLRFAAVRPQPLFPPTATTPVQIALCPTRPAFGERKLVTTPSPTW